MGTDIFRKYINIMDEAVRGVLMKPGAGPNNSDYAIRPTDPEERNLVAKGLKTARAYNQNLAKYAAAPGEKQGVDRASAQARAKGSISGSIIHPDGTGREEETGMPVTLPRGPESGTWQTRAINTKHLNNTTVAGDIKANQGKATGPKKPTAPW
jgi:hypothetical protein